MLRAAGLFSQDPAAVCRFVDQMREAAEPARRQHLRLLAFPPERSIVAAVIAADSRPPVRWASRPDGSFLILDGEIYNAAELDGEGRRSEVGHADLLLDLYSAAGEEAMARVDAAATIVIWDATRQFLSMFRDRGGIVPSFYWPRPDGLVWASHIETLLATEVPRDLNSAAVDFFLASGFVPAPWTLLQRVARLPTAHVLRRVGDGTITVRRYWRPVGQPKLRLSPKETTEHLGRLFKQALRRRHCPGARTGLLLSGGIDSGLVLAGLTKLLGASVDTFTFRYADYDGKMNEVDLARRTAEHFGSRHHEVVVRPAAIADQLSWLLRSYGEPFTYGLHTFMLRDVAEADVQVLFTGAGGDGWYLTRTNAHGLLLARLPAVLRRLGHALIPLIGRWKPAAAEKAKAVIDCAETGRPSDCNPVMIPDALRAGLYRDPGWAAEHRRALEELYDASAEDFPGESDRDRITYVNRQFINSEYLLHWNHWWGRAHGLALRFPYFDADLYDFVVRLPRANSTKQEIRDLAATLMLRDMAYMPKYHQSVPIGHWFRGPLRDFLCDQLSAERLRSQDLFDGQAIRRLLHSHLQGSENHGMRLWAIIALLTWLDLVNRPLSADSAEAIGHPSRRERSSTVVGSVFGDGQPAQYYPVDTRSRD